MRLDFKHIDIEGFLSIGKVSLDLSENGLTLVSGKNNNPSDNSKSNGAGKSTIFEAIVYAVSGSTLRGTKNVVNVNYPNGMKIELTLMRGSDVFRIVRSRDHKEKKTGVWLYLNDEDVSGKSMKECEEVIISYIPELSSEIINSVVILGQGLPNRLTSFTPKKRKELLEELSQTSYLIKDISDRLSDRLNSQTVIKDKLERSNKDSEVEINVYTRDIEKIKNDSVFPLDELKLDLEKYQSENAKNNEDYKDKELQEKTFDEVISKYQKLESEAKSVLSTHKYKIDTCEKKIVDLSKNICPTCHRPYDNAEDMKREQELEKERQQILLSELTPLKEAYDKATKDTQEARDVKKDIVNEKTEIYKRITTCNGKINHLLTQIGIVENSQKTIHEKEEEILKLQEKIKKSQPELDKLTTSLTSLGYLNRALSKEFKTVLLQGVIDYINLQLEKYSSIFFGKKDYIIFSAQGNDLDVLVDKKEYECLSGGERQKTDLAIQFALRDMLINITGFSCNMIVLDEVFDNLDEKGCKSLLTILGKIFSDIDSVYVITHHSDISIPKDNEICITKDYTGCSSIHFVRE